MRVGKLTERVDLQIRSSEKDAAGEQLNSWVSVGLRRAEIVHLSGNEFLTAKGAGSEVTTKINLRYDPVTQQAAPSLRIVDQRNGDIYDIQSVIPHKSSKQFIECLCKRDA